jgi:MFS family permease
MFRSRWLALVILCTSLMVILDGTIVTVALPTIQRDLGFTAGSLSWVMNAYLIAFGGLLLLSGRLGDLIGRKRMFLTGIAVFVLASLACGLAAGPAMLITARFVQGAGAAMASAVTLGMIARLFAQPAERNRAIGGFAFTGAVGASAGLVIGGLLVTLYMQRALGYRPAVAGLGLLPAAAVIAAVSLGLSARLTSRFGSRKLLLSGLVMITAALAALSRIPAHAQYVTWLLPALVLFGAGGGLTLPAVTALGMADATDLDAGVISGMFNTAQQVGGALGLALLTSLAAWRTGSGVSAQALTSGYQLAFAAGAGLAAASVAVAAVALRPRASGAGEPPAAPVTGHVDLVGAADAAECAPPVA